MLNCKDKKKSYYIVKFFHMSNSQSFILCTLAGPEDPTQSDPKNPGSDVFGYVKILDWVLSSPWFGFQSVNNWYLIEYQLLSEALNGISCPYVFLSLSYILKQKSQP